MSSLDACIRCWGVGGWWSVVGEIGGGGKFSHGITRDYTGLGEGEIWPRDCTGFWSWMYFFGKIKFK